MSVIDFSEIEYRKKREGISFKSVTGEKSQLVVFKYARGEKTDHSHENEQIGSVLSGEGKLFIEESTYELKAGVAYHIPGGARHGFTVTGVDGLELIESYSPSKAENEY